MDFTKVIDMLLMILSILSQLLWNIFDIGSCRVDIILSILSQLL
ncbi:MAG: hypothetical protein N3E41_08940 [Thermofilaceae archaeon]|nr:hypothetical protein [Thermofilaceae archaeon]